MLSCSCAKLGIHRYQALAFSINNHPATIPVWLSFVKYTLHLRRETAWIVEISKIVKWTTSWRNKKKKSTRPLWKLCRTTPLKVWTMLLREGCFQHKTGPITYGGTYFEEIWPSNGGPTLPNHLEEAHANLKVGGGAIVFVLSRSLKL